MNTEILQHLRYNNETVRYINDNDNRNQKTPLKLWEINHFFKCPVVGMCLSLTEQKQLLKKAGISIKNKSPFEVHEILVASSENENCLSRKADNLLSHKFGKEMELLLGLDSEEFQNHFKSAFKAGKSAGVIWAAAVKSDLSLGIRREIFGDIHMAMHWNGEQSIRLKQKLAVQQKEIDELRERIYEASQFRRELQKENKRLSENLIQAKTALMAVEKEKSRLAENITAIKSRLQSTELETENRMLKEKLETLKIDKTEKDRRMAILQESNTRLSSKIEQQQKSKKLIGQEAQEILGKVFALNRCDTSCPSFDLCKKRILLVGGITRIASLYREIIESSGGILEYHDGYMKKGSKSLECLLRRADVVVCPVNCNSHAACSIVKNLAKKHNKTVHMLANSSLNAVSQVIRGAATTAPSISESRTAN